MRVMCFCTQAEALPAVAQTTAESDSDSGVGSPAEEAITEMTEKKGDLPGKVTQQ